MPVTSAAGAALRLHAELGPVARSGRSVGTVCVCVIGVNGLNEAALRGELGDCAPPDRSRGAQTGRSSRPVTPAPPPTGTNRFTSPGHNGIWGDAGAGRALPAPNFQKQEPEEATA